MLKILTTSTRLQIIVCNFEQGEAIEEVIASLVVPVSLQASDEGSILLGGKVRAKLGVDQLHRRSGRCGDQDKRKECVLHFFIYY